VPTLKAIKTCTHEIGASGNRSKGYGEALVGKGILKKGFFGKRIVLVGKFIEIF